MRRLLPTSLKTSRGFALVLVLSFVALAMILVLALLTRATTDQTITNSQVEHHRVSRLADSAISIALAQLRTATETNYVAKTPKPWTSQPGAIRVHSMDGSLDSIYKLYTSPKMRVNSAQQLAEDQPPANWASLTQEFVDLNSPTVMQDGDLHFPIFDPRDASDDLGDPVEGFDYDTQGAPTGTLATASNPNNRRLPMPVRWIYMLQDGTLGTLGMDRQFIGFNPLKSATADNPIVSRIAFWMDDESSKINVNTASEGAFWDTPRADTGQERMLAGKQPTRLEYQRQPGHPAGVSLSSVLLPGQRFHPDGFSSQMPAMSLENARDLWRIGRLQIADKDAGTSKGGTVIPDVFISETEQASPKSRQARYADFDSLYFDDYKDTSGVKGEGSGASTKTRKKQPFFETHPSAVKRLRRASGFLTAHSAAPELTLFGTPRIALWPVHASTPGPGENRTESEPVLKYSPYDQMAVMASTLGKERYLIQRSDPGNGAMDLEIHAVGKDGRGQNVRLLDYLRQLTDRPFPGYQKSANATFAAKYGTDEVTGDRDAILLSMMDYVRSTNFADGHLTADTQFSVLCPGEAYYGFGQVAPMQPRITGPSNEAGKADPIKGLGRMMTVSEVAMIIICRAEVDAEGKRQGNASSTNRNKLVNPGDREIEVGFLIEGFLPEQGWADYRPFASVAMVGGAPGASPRATDAWPALMLNGQRLEPLNNYTSMQAEANPPVGWRGWGGSTGVRGLTKGVIMFKPIAITGEGDEPPILTFNGGSNDALQLKLAVYDTPTGAGAMSASTADLIQVIPLKIPDIIPDISHFMRLPRLPQGSDLAYPLANRVNDAAKKANTNGTPKMLVHEQDIIQSLIPAHGDYRLIASRRWVESKTANPSPLFAAHPQWGRQRQAHALRDPSCILTSSGTAAGITSLAAQDETDPGFFYYQLQVPASVQPDFPQAQGLFMKGWVDGGWKDLTPQSISDQLRLDGMKRGQAWPDYTGDFDNGSGNSPDGPYTNRPDDGNWAALPQNELPYFSADKTTQKEETVPPVTLSAFSAQRLLPSPVMFGSLPTGTRAQVPWQTLLFRPDPGNHYGAQEIPDHLFLDLFWSPVLEPEPVSQPLETAGKINLNHQIIPFGHIHRTTALHAAMKAETLMAIPDSAAASYKTGEHQEHSFRKYIDATATLQLWQNQVFDQGRVFLTPGEICQYPLVPEGEKPDLHSMQSFWAVHRLTGDNSKERPYAYLYSRLTTQSNTFRLHYVVETIKKARSTQAAMFDPAKDQITAREQGSALLRRRLDFQSDKLPDYLTESTPEPLTKYYQWEIIRHRRRP